MAGAHNAGRGQYTAAGYTFEETARENDLYIADGQAEFTRELIRDNNRIGYSEPEFDDDGLPFSFFIDEAQREERRTQEKKERMKTAEKRREQQRREMTFTERLSLALHKERRAAAVCGILLALNLTLLAFFGQAAIDGVRKRDQIEGYEDGSKAYQMEIESVKRQIDQAKNGELIRNKAQNELGMLRGERVATETIYIQAPTQAADEEMNEEMVKEESSLLDWLLSVADVFDFKS